MRSIESTGKTVEEAVQAGLNQLGLELPDVTISVIEEGSKGFFGLFGAKSAKVRITERDREPEIDMSQILRPGASTRVSTIADKPRQPKPVQQPKPTQPQSKPVQQPKATQPQSKPVQQPKATQPQSKPVQPQPKAAQPQPKPTQQPKAAQPQPKAAQPQSKPAQQPKAARQPRPTQPHADIARPVIPEGPLPDQDPSTLSELGRRAYEYLDKLTHLIGVDVKIYVAEAEGSMSISMMGDTLGILIGRRGDTLDALQYLTSLEVNRDRDDYVRVSLDTEHYRAKREESLKRLANRMADRAVKSGRKVVLEPMNPYERRILHSALQDHPSVETHSEGDEPNRRVVITLKGDAAQSEGDTAPRPAKRGPRVERRDNRAPRADKPRQTRPARSDNVPKPAQHHVPMAHDVPDDPTDDTL